MFKALSSFLLIFVAGLFFNNISGFVAAQNSQLLVRVKNANGEETSLFQKLITVSASNNVRETPDPNSKAKRVVAYNIFYRLKSDDGQLEKNGMYRIGDSTGKPLGWISPSDVQVWDTRFVIAPRQIDESTTFTIDMGHDAKAIYDPEEIPDDATAYSFVLGPSKGTGADADENGPFPVCFCIARIADEGTLAELNQIGDMTLEIVFVIEATSYLNVDYEDNGKELLEYVKELGDSYRRLVDQQNEGRIPVRFGLVLFQDASNNFPLKSPSVVQPLTDNLDEWLAKLKGIVPTSFENDSVDDWPNDGLSGVSAAIAGDNVGWSVNSSKHVVVIGHSDFHHDGFRKGSSPPVRHPLSWIWDRTDPTDFFTDDSQWSKRFGYNTSGNSVQDITSAASPSAGTIGQELRLAKHIHAIHIGQTIEQMFKDADDPNLLQKIRDFNERVKQITATMTFQEQLNFFSSQIDENPELFSFISLAYQIELKDAYDKTAVEKYQAIANQDGYFTHMEPNGSDVRRVTSELKQRIEDAIRLISDVATGNEDRLKNTASGNEFTRPIFRLVGSTLSRQEIIDKPVQLGDASTRDLETGRSVGEKRIMVSRVELNRLRGTFNSLFEQFNKKRQRADRQDVNTILDDLKTSLAAAASGQTIDSSTNLAALITDLPLRTEALKLTAGDIAIMSTDNFDRWLGELDVAVRRIDELLNGDQKRWTKIASLGDASEQYAFLRLSELP